jgi:hypothetical protein
MGGHRRVAQSSGLAGAALADGDGGAGLRCGAPNSNDVVGMERAIGFGKRREDTGSVGRSDTGRLYGAAR